MTLKPRVYGNFKPEPGPKKNKEPAAKRRPGMSDAHLALIRKLPCCITGEVPAGTVHHLKGGDARKERGIRQRATDQWGVPLSWGKHVFGRDAVERFGSTVELKWFQDRGIENPYLLAKALWQATGNLERMWNIVLAHLPPGAKRITYEQAQEAGLIDDE